VFHHAVLLCSHFIDVEEGFIPARRKARGSFAFPTNQSFVLSLPFALTAQMPGLYTTLQQKPYTTVIMTITRSFLFFWLGTSFVERPLSGTKRQKRPV
jgi:hypothetical protein